MHNPCTSYICCAVCLHLQAFLEEETGKSVKLVGNRTECAMLMLMRSWDVDYRNVRNDHQDKIYRVCTNIWTASHSRHVSRGFDLGSVNSVWGWR